MVAAAQWSLYFMVRSQPIALDVSLTMSWWLLRAAGVDTKRQVALEHEQEPLADEFWVMSSWLPFALAHAPKDAAWFVLCDPQTRFNVPLLRRTLAAWNPAGSRVRGGIVDPGALFVGAAIVDSVGSVAREYDVKRAYPYLPAAVALSRSVAVCIVKASAWAAHRCPL